MYYQVKYTSVSTGKRLEGPVRTSETEAMKELKQKSMSKSYKNVILVSGTKLKK